VIVVPPWDSPIGRGVPGTIEKHLLTKPQARRLKPKRSKEAQTVRHRREEKTSLVQTNQACSGKSLSRLEGHKLTKAFSNSFPADL
jgi:hypothetical protein